MASNANRKLPDPFTELEACLRPGVTGLTITRTLAQRLVDMGKRLKKTVARDSRKAEHGCSDAMCSLCDPEQPDDGTWEFSS
jgi:hypothetical protein